MSLLSSLGTAWKGLSSASKFATGAGALQAIGGGIMAFKDYKDSQAAEKELDAKAKAGPLYQGSSAINDYYQQALNRYSQNPYQSQQYKVGEKNILRSSASALKNAQTRKAGVDVAGRIQAGENAGLGNLGAQVEAGQGQRFSQLGQAAQAYGADRYKMFDINQLTPYNRMFGLKQMKAQAANERFRNSFASAIGGLSNIASLGSASSSRRPDESIEYKTPGGDLG